ncbi:MAG: amidohydrolase family protein [Phycisphaerales bacterium]|nr:amidohydrolase family protein [Phycisphaerales bacterium]
MPSILRRAGRRSSALAALSSTLALAAVIGAAIAQPAPPNGPRPVDPRWHALTGATVTTRPGETIENATIVIRDGVIVSVGAGGAAPNGARVWDVSGLHVYPGLIDAHVPVDAPAPDAKAPGAHWNDRVIPQRSALSGPGLSDKDREAFRKLGFTAAAIAPKGGVFRGSGAVITLGDSPSESEAGVDAVNSRAFHEVSFETRGFGDASYPGSQMGAIALIRQTLSDAQWRAEDVSSYAAHPGSRSRPMPADALDALRPGVDQPPLLFDVSNELEALRAAKIAREFDRKAMLVGSGLEFRRLDAIKEAGVALIVPLNFPETPKVQTQAEIESVGLRELMTWEQAPTNPRRLDGAGVTVALTTDKLRKREDFMKNVRRAIEHGLPEDRALAMLTTVPARLLGVEDRLGEIAPGRIANLIVVKGTLFDEKSELRDVWVDGVRHEIKAAPELDIDGAWTAVFGVDGGPEAKLTVKSKDGKEHSVTAKVGDKEMKSRAFRATQNRIHFILDSHDEPKGAYSMSAVVVGDELLGTGTDPAGSTFRWTAARAPAEEPEADAKDGDKPAPDADDEKSKESQKDKKKPEVPETFGYPFGPYALDALPAQDDLFISNATIWTSGPQGVIRNGSIYVKGGKIAAVGADLRAPAGVRTIDAAGRHVTPGLIDAHSHTGISGGVNEGTQAITSEVRIADVIDPDAAGWYRELAGGLTAVNQLHGSANPIGGQNSVVKIRWGVRHPDEMPFEGAPSGIKFALGENVKQSNWGERNTTRYPQTRMGVETIIADAFTAARDYAARRDAWGRMSANDRRGQLPPARDLELEALAEILAGERLVHCHSYRQDEILMLCRIAERFGFRIGTFQHVLEGYKVADAIKGAAIGGSSFSDWWAYKFEVIDAIPENGAIMHEVGVCVSFNSDSDELARRMNTEAAKAVKYGGVSPEEALKFVTINPAKQLGIEKMTGSLEVGKDADLAIWSGDPLSAFSRCEATFIDGREYFSLESDRAHRQRITAERHRIIQKILAEGAPKKPAKKDGEAPKPDGEAKPEASPADAALAEAIMERNLRLLRSGADPDAHRCGECGTLDLHAH